MKTLITTIAFMVIATQVSALSCMPVHHVTSFEKAVNSDLSYSILHGTFTFDPKTLPSMEERNREDYEPILINSNFEGRVLSRTGFVDILPFEVGLSPICVGPWCGNLATGIETIAFAQRLENGSFLVQPAPCGGQAFQRVTAEMISDIEACAAGNCPDVPASDVPNKN